MDNIIVITQNVKLESLSKLRQFIKPASETLVFSTQLIFENEASIIEKALDSRCTFKNFSDLLTDVDFQNCDEDAFSENQKNVSQYYDEIKKIKNNRLISKLLSIYPCDNRFIVCDDLGIDPKQWIINGFHYVECEYYHQVLQRQKSKLWRFLSIAKSKILFPLKVLRSSIYETYINKQKYLFYGSLNRIGYRLNINFSPASKWENVKYLWIYYTHAILPNSTIRMSTLHEAGFWLFPDLKNCNLKLIQDGYLPPNYSSKYLFFNGKHVEYYTWDIEGGRTFDYHHLKHRVIPFRNKLYLPSPKYPQKVEKILCVASGAGDWTAVKNRSDEDRMISVFGRIAKRFPNIEFVYRCHPVWIHPVHQGVNSIQRAAEYIHWLNLPNLKMSSNVPCANQDGNFILSYKRSSFEEDIEGVDIVFGEHSISQIDAAFKKILFCSVNVTGRRDFFQGISEMGFPHCESEEDICELLKELTTNEFKTRYERAIMKYNEMTNIES